MKSKLQNKATHPTPPTLRKRSCALWLAIACAICMMITACNQPTQQRSDGWIDLTDAVGPGQIVVHNQSPRAITRLWLSPSDVDGLWPGAMPDAFITIAPYTTFESSVPAGWWDVWFEAEDGADALLHRAWFSDHQPTQFEVKESWWSLGDWIEVQHPL